jgi:hypothetical protein
VGRIEGAAPAGAALGAALVALAARQADPGMPAQLRSILGNANSESMLHSLIFQRIQQLVKLETLQEALLQCAPGRLHPVSAERGPPRASLHSSAELRQPARFADVSPMPQLGHSTVRVAQEQLAKVPPPGPPRCSSAAAATRGHDTAWHGTARHGTARHGTTRLGTTRHDTARHESTRARVTATGGRALAASIYFVAP